jgi:hypothetical protein
MAKPTAFGAPIRETIFGKYTKEQIDAAAWPGREERSINPWFLYKF